MRRGEKGGVAHLECHPEVRNRDGGAIWLGDMTPSHFPHPSPPTTAGPASPADGAGEAISSPVLYTGEGQGEGPILLRRHWQRSEESLSFS